MVVHFGVPIAVIAVIMSKMEHVHHVIERRAVDPRVGVASTRERVGIVIAAPLRLNGSGNREEHAASGICPIERRHTVPRGAS
jgi:hypothetical protein